MKNSARIVIRPDTTMAEIRRILEGLPDLSTVVCCDVDKLLLCLAVRDECVTAAILDFVVPEPE